MSPPYIGPPPPASAAARAAAPASRSLPAGRVGPTAAGEDAVERAQRVLTRRLWAVLGQHCRGDAEVDEAVMELSLLRRVHAALASGPSAGTLAQEAFVGYAQAVAALVADLQAGGPPRRQHLATFVRELRGELRVLTIAQGADPRPPRSAPMPDRPLSPAQLARDYAEVLGGLRQAAPAPPPVLGEQLAALVLERLAGPDSPRAAPPPLRDHGHAGGHSGRPG